MKGLKEVCHICGKELCRGENLRLHMKTHEKDGEDYYGKRCVETHTIQFHPDSDFQDLSNDPKHPSKSWDYFLYNAKTGDSKCRFCGVLLVQPPCKKVDHIGHLKRIHNVNVEKISREKDPEKHKCLECGKILKDAPGLRDHINTHTGERPHVCKYCGKTFASSGNMHAHIRQAHLGKKRNSNERKSHSQMNLPLPLNLPGPSIKSEI